MPRVNPLAAALEIADIQAAAKRRHVIEAHTCCDCHKPALLGHTMCDKCRQDYGGQSLGHRPYCGPERR